MNERLVKLRKELGLTTRSFGEKINVSASTITNLEKGTRNITDRTISDICREFSVNESWFRTGEGEMFNTRTLDEDLAFAFGQLSAVKNEELKKALLLLTELSDEQIMAVANMVKTLKGDNK